MGELDENSPKTCPPYMNTKDCTTQPPPFSFLDDQGNKLDRSESSSFKSPLLIALIGILVSALLLVSYYALINKYCGRKSSPPSMGGDGSHNQEEEEEEENQGQNINPSFDPREPWFMSTNGLDEALIKKITLVKYKKGDNYGGLLSSMCSICLGEILEDDTLRLLPKCSHAFHVGCIDTWLKSHSNCPLCRATITPNFAHSQKQPSPPPQIVSIEEEEDDEGENGNFGEARLVEDEGEMGAIQQERDGNSPKCPFRALSDLGHHHHGSDGLGQMIMRRSISMDHPHETRVSIAESLRFGDTEEGVTTGESSKISVIESRSNSNARFLFYKHGRGRNSVVIPV